MKKVISSLLVVAMAIGINTAKADNVSLQEAREAAAYFMNYYNSTEKWTANDLELVYQIDNKVLGIPASYFFNLAGDGWIIMAATTVIDPIIGYNTEGWLDPEDFPANMKWWVEGYSDMVSEIQQLDAENDYPDDPMWTALNTKTYKGDTKEASHLLMSENWSQGNNYYPTFNSFCPQSITDGRYAVTGCVATAISQIIHYFRYPKKGTGLARYWLRQQLTSEEAAQMPNDNLKYNFDDSAAFNYDLMPNRPLDNNGNQTCTDEEMRECARLNYAVGVAVKMGYHPDGSGAVSMNVPGYISQYFKYERGQLIYRNGTTDTAYMNAIRRNLMNNIPLYMCGSSKTGTGPDAAGHAWVCCGYKDEDTNRYYMNWGWVGNTNGFYNLGKNNMYISSQNLNFTERQGYIDGLVPPDDSNRFLVNIVEADPTTQLGSPYPNPAVQSVTLPYSTENAAELVVYNIEGRPVATYRVQAGSGELNIRVDALPAGVYIYRMNSQTGKIMVK